MVERVKLLMSVHAAESPKDELLEDGPKTPARNVDGEEDENYYDPRTPGKDLIPVY